MMMMRRFTLLLVPVCLLAGLLAAGCGSSSLRGGDDAREAEIQTLKTRILQLQQEAAMNQVELAQLRQKVAELDARNGGARPAGPPATPVTPVTPARAPAAAPPRTSQLTPVMPVTPTRPEPARPVTRQPVPLANPP
ncbi:MAG: hypothetical protein WAM82_20330, partial [Thermoanaerobaculia bacterium]